MRRSTIIIALLMMAAMAESAPAAMFVDTFQRADGPLGAAPDGRPWLASGAATPQIRGGQMVSPATAPAGAAYAAVTLDEVPEFMSTTFTVSGAPGQGDVVLGLLNNRPDPVDLLENAVHIVITNRSWSIGLVDGAVGRGGGLVELVAGVYPDLPAGTYAASIRRAGDTVELIDPRGDSHFATDPRLGAFWGARCDWEIINQTVGGREARIARAEAGPGLPTPFDLYPPTSAPSPGAGGFVNTTQTTMGGTAADHARASSGVQHVEVSVADLATGQWWDGAQWQPDERYRVAQGTTAWQVSAPPLVPGRGYLVRSRARDNAGNTQFETSYATLFAVDPAADPPPAAVPDPLAPAFPAPAAPAAAPAPATSASATAAVDGVPDRRPTVGIALRASPARDRRSPYRFAFAGSIRLPAAVGRAEGCRGTVRLQLVRGSRTLATGTARIGSTCAFRRVLTFRPSRGAPRSGALTATVRFLGNRSLREHAGQPVTLRYG